MNITDKQRVQIRNQFAKLLKTTASQIILCDATFSRKAKGCGLEWWVVTCQVEKCELMKISAEGNTVVIGISERKIP